jgi:hypothetical protein
LNLLLGSNLHFSPIAATLVCMENGNGHISTRGIEHAVEHFSKAVDLARAERSPTFFMPALKYLSASSITSEPLRCVALRSSWSTYGGTCTHKSAPMLGAQ